MRCQSIANDKIGLHAAEHSAGCRRSCTPCCPSSSGAAARGAAAAAVTVQHGGQITEGPPEPTASQTRQRQADHGSKVRCVTQIHT